MIEVKAGKPNSIFKRAAVEVVRSCPGAVRESSRSRGACGLLAQRNGLRKEMAFLKATDIPSTGESSRIYSPHS